MSQTSATWTLLDAAAQARAFPTSFTIPSHRVRSSLGVSDLVKVCLVRKTRLDGIAPAGERLWCAIEAVRTPLRSRVVYYGALRNLPVVFTELGYGSPIVFGPEHVLDVEERCRSQAGGAD